MGAWGAGSFENDTALDWAAGVRSVDDVRKPFERLKAESDAAPELELDADLACELIAAAECVATMMGRRVPDVPDEVAAALAGGQVDDLLFHQARNAVLHVLRHSELAELWEETAGEGEDNEWHGEITALVARLDPEIEFVPWEKEDAISFGGGGTACAFCNQPMTYADGIGIDIHDYSDINAFNPQLLAHLACLNRRLHHSHVIHNMKHDPDNPPDLGQL